METLKDKSILLAGATGSIGAATARLLAQGGARLFLAGRNEQKLRELHASLSGNGHQWFVWDACSEQSVQQMAEQVHQVVPQMDVLINASGVGLIHPLEQLSVADFKRSIDINLTGMFLLLKHFLPPMKQAKKGLIVAIPGVLGKVPMAGAAAYSASKYGLVGMLQSVREELKRTEIRVTQLFLGGVDSAFWDEIDLRVQRDKMIRAEEAARAIWFLCQQPLSGVVSEMALQPFNHQAI
jgi:NADP-dependent 3-hydroxy acid dehydrogenase YdfG